MLSLNLLKKREASLTIGFAKDIEKDGIVKQEVAKEGVARQYSPPSNKKILLKGRAELILTQACRQQTISSRVVYHNPVQKSTRK